MTSTRSGIAVGCSTCTVDLLLAATEENALRTELAAFFHAHAGCSVFMDVSRTAVPLPRRSVGSSPA